VLPGQEDHVRSVIAPLPNQRQSVGSIQVTGSNNQVIIQQNSNGEGRNSDVPKSVVPTTAEASASTGWNWFFGISVALITLLALPVLVNLLTGQSPLPGWLQAIVPYSAPLIGASLFLLGVLYLWQMRLQRRGAVSSGQAQRDRIEIPSRDTLLTKSRNIHQESEDAFERAVDLQLGIQRVPQLVAAQHLPHIAARATTAARSLTEPLVDYLLRVEKLLLVGAPGAGKSATLRTLWGELLSRAQSDPGLPVPFLLNLSTFSRYSGTFRNWLAQALNECAGMPLAIGQKLFEGGQLFLLLDGLDEMAESRRAAAMTELNELLTAADPALYRCVVCSRTLEYEQSGVVLHFPAALELQPLTAAQVQEAVTVAGPAVNPLAAALNYDPALAELLETPLLLTIAARTFAGNPHLVLSGSGFIELRRSLFDEYIAQILRRSKLGSLQRTLRLLRTLRWLTRHLTNELVTLFLIERMQPTLLGARSLYKLIVGLVIALMTGATTGLLVGLSLGMREGFAYGTRLGLVFGVGFGFVFESQRIRPTESLVWSWSQVREHWSQRRPFHESMADGLLVGLPLGCWSWLSDGWMSGLLHGLVYCLAIALYLWLGVPLSKGWVKSLCAETNLPNEGIRASIRNGVVEGFTSGLVVGLVIGLGRGLFTGLVFWRSRGLTEGLDRGLSRVLLVLPFFWLLAGLLVALRGGLGDAIKHYVLRICLRFEVGLPLRLVPFLERCRSMLLLRREGGGYRFWHVTLQEHFATLDDARMNDIAERSLAKDAYQSKY
jgi:hypothetical protein